MPVSTVLVSSTLTAGVGGGTSGTIDIPDYTVLLDRIAIALENISTQSTTLATNSTTIANNLTAIATDIDTMASNSTTIKDKQTTIADKQTTIADKQTAMETYQKKLKELGEGAGIHMIGAYDIFGMISTYRLMIEQAKVLDNTDKATASQITAALAEVDRVSQLIKDNIPREF